MGFTFPTAICHHSLVPFSELGLKKKKHYSHVWDTECNTNGGFLLHLFLQTQAAIKPPTRAKKSPTPLSQQPTKLQVSWDSQGRQGPSDGRILANVWPGGTHVKISRPSKTKRKWKKIWPCETKVTCERRSNEHTIMKPCYSNVTVV